MLEKNTGQVNRLIARMFLICSAAVVALVLLAWIGVFEFGKGYTLLLLTAGLIITLSPNLLIKIMPDNAMRNLMMVMLSVFIGVLGTNNHIGIYITYALVPIFSCLYFDPKFTVNISIFSYIVMAVSLYFNSAGKYEVVYQGRPRIQMYLAYLTGFTFEYVIVGMILNYLVKRARRLMEERYSAEEENRMKTRILSAVSHELRTPMNAVIGLTDVALRENMNDDLRKNLTAIRSSSSEIMDIINKVLDLSKIESGNISIENICGDNMVSETTAECAKKYYAEQPAPFVTKNVRALIVDDNELNREIVKVVLDPLKMDFDYAENGLEAVKMAEKTRYDIIFMDSHMPVMNGGDAARNIRSSESSLSRDVPIIAVTADAVRGSRERLMDSGMTDFILKPIDTALLFAIVKKYLPEEKTENI